MSSDDARKPPQRYRQKTRVVAVLVSGAFTLPVLFVFGVTLRQLSKPPEPSIYAAPPAPPEPSSDPTSTTAPTEGSSPPIDPL